jgi:hypothetical protein
MIGLIESAQTTIELYIGPVITFISLLNHSEHIRLYERSGSESRLNRVEGYLIVRKDAI